MNRNIKRNYKEAKWLFTASLVCTLIMAGWALAQWPSSSAGFGVGGDRDHGWWLLDYLTVAELYLTGTVLLFCLFGPKLYVLLRYEPVVVECEYGRRLTATTGGTLKPAKIRHQSGKKALPSIDRGGDGLYDLFEGAASPVSWSPSPEPHSNTATGGSSMSSGVSSGGGGGLLSPSRMSSGGGGSSVRSPSPMGSSVALAGHHPSSSAYSSSSMSGKRSVSGSGDEGAAGMTKVSYF